MESIRVYYNGSVFMPSEPLHIKKDAYYDIAFSKVEEQQRVTDTLAALQRINDEFDALDDSEPMTDEVLDLINTRVNFSRELEP